MIVLTYFEEEGLFKIVETYFPNNTREKAFKLELMEAVYPYRKIESEILNIRKKYSGNKDFRAMGYLAGLQGADLSNREIVTLWYDWWNDMKGNFLGFFDVNELPPQSQFPGKELDKRGQLLFYTISSIVSELAEGVNDAKFERFLSEKKNVYNKDYGRLDIETIKENRNEATVVPMAMTGSKVKLKLNPDKDLRQCYYFFYKLVDEFEVLLNSKKELAEFIKENVAGIKASTATIQTQLSPKNEIPRHKRLDLQSPTEEDLNSVQI